MLKSTRILVVVSWRVHHIKQQEVLEKSPWLSPRLVLSVQLMRNGGFLLHHKAAVQQPFSSNLNKVSGTFHREKETSFKVRRYKKSLERISFKSYFPHSSFQEMWSEASKNFIGVGFSCLRKDVYLHCRLKNVFGKRGFLCFFSSARQPASVIRCNNLL